MPGSVNARPRWLAATAVVTGVAILLGLGSWQMLRRAEKHALIERIETRMAVPPVALPARIDDAGAWDYRRVTVSGRFLHEREIHLSSRTRDGVVGVEVVTPLERPDGTTVLINRGWVPRDLADPATRASGQVAGPVTATGIARMPSAPGLFTPDNQPDKGFWIRADVAEIAASRDLDTVLPVIVEAGPAPNPGGWPKGGRAEIHLPDNHLQYALTWYALAAVLVIVALIAGRRQRRKS